MLRLLARRNHELLRSVMRMSEVLQRASIPTELEPYRARVLQLTDSLAKTVEANLRDLEVGGDLVIEDILSNTRLANRYAQLLSARFASPILRAAIGDRLTLRTIGWLHTQHPRTTQFPATFDDGDTSVWPF